MDKKYLYISLSTIIGSGLGLVYYYYIGCNSGTCPITSKPINSALYGALMGYLFIKSIKS